MFSCWNYAANLRFIASDTGTCSITIAFICYSLNTAGCQHEFDKLTISRSAKFSELSDLFDALFAVLAPAVQSLNRVITHPAMA